MSSATLGSGTSAAEVTEISTAGFWLQVDSRSWFLDYDQFPWFRNAEPGQLRHVLRPTADHLRWPELDIDLALESIRNPAAFPLVSRADRH